jgi:hypothetical protein
MESLLFLKLLSISYMTALLRVAIVNGAVCCTKTVDGLNGCTK